MRKCSLEFRCLRFLSLSLLAVFCSSLQATEPNETFGTATVLSPGVLSVADDLTPAQFPDTVLGARGLFGGVSDYDDDGSFLGNGRASALFGINTNSGTIRFDISGYPDENFDGGHGEGGDYEVFIDAYDSGGGIVDSFSEIRTLQPGQVDTYTFSNFDWLGGSYDVYIDNSTSGLYGDVDFFTFTDLTPGAAFTARTIDPNASHFLETLLGWFDSNGNLVDSDDFGDSESISLLEGIVPSEGTLTFAVTGYFDNDFIGSHYQSADYELELTFGITADFDADGDVDGRDFLVWQRNPSVGSLSDWQAQYGNGTLAAASVVPEPASLTLALAATCGWYPFFRVRKKS